MLDVVYDNGGFDECLSEAQWNFGMRAVQIDYDTNITPSFGYARAFNKPSDFIILSAFCSDEYYIVPKTNYVEEVDNWYTDIDKVYVKYVSNDASYGGNIGSWPALFADFVAAHFADKIVGKLTGNKSPELIQRFFPPNIKHGIRAKALLNAKSRNAMGNPSKSMAQGGWSRARAGGNGRRDGGSSSNLTG